VAAPVGADPPEQVRGGWQRGQVDPGKPPGNEGRRSVFVRAAPGGCRRRPEGPAGVDVPSPDYTWPGVG